jgi:small subunit ribosomal protein S24e
VLYSFTVGLIF